MTSTHLSREEAQALVTLVNRQIEVQNKQMDLNALLGNPHTFTEVFNNHALALHAQRAIAKLSSQVLSGVDIEVGA